MTGPAITHEGITPMTAMLTLARTLAETVVNQHRWNQTENCCGCRGAVSEEEWPGHLLDMLAAGGVTFIPSDRLDPDVLAAALHEIEHLSTTVAARVPPQPRCTTTDRAPHGRPDTPSPRCGSPNSSRD